MDLKKASIDRVAREKLRRLIVLIRTRTLGTITCVHTDNPLAALTFDDGPHPEYTPRLLNILDGHGARATFFMIGRQAQMYPELIRRVAKAGHAIANHTQDHPLFLAIGGRERRRQIRACTQALAPYDLRLFRPPRGHQSLWSRLDILLLGHRAITWSVHAEDWLNHGPGWMADRLERRIKPGSIVLLHDAIWDPMEDGASDRDAVLEAVDMVLERLNHKFRFVTVPELLRHGRPVRQDWYSLSQGIDSKGKRGPS